MTHDLRVDPISQEVISEGLLAIMAEMRANVMRSAYSSVIALLNDFSCGLFDPQGQLIAQGPDHPGHVIPLPWGVRSCMEDLGAHLEPGDVVLFNDPYRGGTHLNDVTVLLPVFHDGELFCFPAVRAHWADIGGTSPGSYSGAATNIFYEGLRIPPLKIYEGGKRNESVFALIMNNVRLREEREGDLAACLGACRVGEERVLELRERYGSELFMAAVAQNMDRAEARMRRQIEQLPDGEYLAEDYLEFFTDGMLDPARVALTLTIDGDELIADFRGSSDQLPGVVNSTAAVTLAGVIIAVKSALDPSAAINAGSFRPITCLTRPGSIVDVAFDAPANAHGEVRKRAVSVTLSALSKIVPRLVSGDLCGTSFPNSFGGWDRGKQRSFVHTAFPSGGNGGTAQDDGPSALGNVDMGSLPLNFPVEEQESIFPFVVEQIAMRPDSEGAGENRGGLGAVVRIRMKDDAESVMYSFTSDRAVIPPWGIFGAGAAASVLNLVEPAGSAGTQAFQLGYISSFPLGAGDSVVLLAAGGGGYGDPLDRDPGRVADDVADGYVTAQRARDNYGVVLDEAGAVRIEETTRLRSELRSGRVRLPLHRDDRPVYVGTRGSHRTQRISPGIAAALGVGEGDLIELSSPHGPTLRAWVRCDASEPFGLGMDDVGLELLGAVVGDVVELRAPVTVNDANDRTIRTGPVVAHEG